MITLTENELRQLIKVTKKNQRTLYGVCPKCSKSEFGISLNSPHLFGCFRKKKCGFSGNIFTLLKFLGIRGFSEKKEYPGLTIETKIEKFEKENFQILETVNMPIGFKRVSKSDYLDSRGYNSKDYQNYKIGITNLDLKLKDRIIIGFTDVNGDIGYIARSLNGQEPRYRNGGKNFSKMLDGLHETDYPEATLVEGHFDRINLRNCFTELGIKNRAISTFGAKISDYQINLLIAEGITKVNLFFEQDVYKILLKSSEKLIHKFEEFKIMKTSSLESDPGSMDIFEIAEAYLNRQNFFKFATTELPKLEL
jgi:hypothetical protein